MRKIKTESKKKQSIEDEIADMKNRYGNYRRKYTQKQELSQVDNTAQLKTESAKKSEIPNLKISKNRELLLK